ncbi:hypothetical protein M427DRAFT_151459 [Gonapodya prolifera JEL478]|uniref:HAD-like protein n=1 Tax=Gonapodya prolifera (strain JEL478) TaxID=1344416 RepID=A0A139AXJ1_GONPJ|nr:hypothetical protein M427DRAFT_151459 [Gonapodya prolifera JEL478]|eukprot:KXS21429.1 hypothetical protein M427DRAFT_151459 [Gonapodya prolifera JEL478]
MSEKHLEVFLDFDGTICLTDTIDHLHNLAIGDMEGKRLEEIYVAVTRGEILFREGYDRIVEALNMTWDEAMHILEETCLLDSGMPEFISWCKENGFGVTVVSGGFTKLIDHILRRNLSSDLVDYMRIEACAIEVIPSGTSDTGDSRRAKWTITHRDSSPIGYDKSKTIGEVVATVKEQKGKDVLVAFAGDGLNDVNPSQISDYVFARRNTRLSRWWESNVGLPLNTVGETEREAEGNKKWWVFDNFSEIKKTLAAEIETR